MTVEARFVHDGLSVDYWPVADTLSGTVVVLEDLVGVANLTIAAGKKGALRVAGVLDFAKEVSGGVTFAIGAKVYWDDTNKVAVATDGGGANKYVGKAIIAAVDADEYVRVRLEGGAQPTTLSQAAHQADSEASTIAATVIDLNALMAKLQATGLMASA
jgi:predicted RecA/RadA family phage recombinase